MLFITLGTLLLHVQFAKVGWFFRYEAYLFALAVPSIAVALPDVVLRTTAWLGDAPVRLSVVVLASVALLMPLFHRATVVGLTPTATSNIYQQQYRMARFLGAYYDGQSVALNDIGAVTYYTDVRLFDTFGLGSLESATLRLQGRTSAHGTEALARQADVRVAIVYDEWLMRDGGVPASWQKAGEWSVSNPVAVDKPTVVFYAVEPTELAPLRQRLGAFAQREAR